MGRKKGKMKRSRIEKMLRARWIDKVELLTRARALMERCIEWPLKQDEDFGAVIVAMGETWKQDYEKHIYNLETNLKGLEQMK